MARRSCSTDTATGASPGCPASEAELEGRRSPAVVEAACLLVEQKAGADRAAEVTQCRDLDRRRAVVDEQVRVHALGDPLGPGVAEPGPEPAADDHRLDVEQVDRRGDPGPERLIGLVHQLLGELVAVLQRALPDAAGQPVATALLHDLEELRLVSLVLDEVAGADLHRPAPGVGLHASVAAAGALAAVDLDH